MSDVRTILERGVGGATPAHDGFHRMLRRPARKRRTQRIAAGVVGIAVFVAAVLTVTSGLLFDRTQTTAGPRPAIDNGFRGRYQLIAHQTGGGGCPVRDYVRRVHVHYISERV